MACSVTGKDKVGPAKRCFFGSLYVCMCPDAKKELGEETNISPPFFSILLAFGFFSHPLTLSFSLLFFFFEGLTCGNEISLA